MGRKKKTRKMSRIVFIIRNFQVLPFPTWTRQQRHVSRLLRQRLILWHTSNETGPHGAVDGRLIPFQVFSPPLEKIGSALLGVSLSRWSVLQLNGITSSCRVGFLTCVLPFADSFNRRRVRSCRKGFMPCLRNWNFYRRI